VQKRQQALRRELEEIHARKRRAVRQRRAEHYTACLVGYTNAGKSTLFNALTAGGAYADDRLFATLVTRTREWAVGEGPEGASGGLSVMLSDTVGFVRDLPHNLVASFRATLEEAVNADLLLIVLDVSDPAAEMQYETVVRTLDELEEEASRRRARAPREAGGDGGGAGAPARLLLLNKVDRLKDNRELLVWQRKVPGAIPISAVDPSSEGIGELKRRVLAMAQGPVRTVRITVPMSAGRAVQMIETRAQVLERHYEDGTALLRCRIGQRSLDQVRSAAGGGIRVEEEEAEAGPGALQRN
jgi:GTP-binding protein HflX